MDARYCVGIPDIDDQHEQISRLIESLQEVAARENRQYLFRPAMKRLQELLNSHFTCEEALMGMVGFAGLPQHRRLHAEILRTFAQYLDETPTPDHYGELGRGIADKVLGHVMSHDLQMIDMVKEYLNRFRNPPPGGGSS